MSISIKEITLAWWDSYFAEESQKKLAKDRLKICEDCPSLKEKFKRVKKISVSFCGECGCPISKKIFSSEFNACPLGKWKNADESNADVFIKRKNKLI